MVAFRVGREVMSVSYIVFLLVHHRRLITAKDAKIEIDSEVISHATIARHINVSVMAGLARKMVFSREL